MDRYEAAMVLGALGNAMGFHNTNQECKKPGLKLDESDLSNEIDALVAKSTQWKVSFDTLMHLATAEALTSGQESLKTFYSQAAKRYLLALDAHQNRLANTPTPARESIQMPTRNLTGSCHVQFTEPMFGAAARTMCIGMRFSKPQQLNDLLQASIECGRMTHSFPTAFLGTFCTALFASYAIQGKPIAHWGWRMMEVMPIAEQYCEKKIAHFSDYRENWFCFETIWQFYLKLRGIQKDGCDIPVFPKSYKIEEQNKLYRGWRSESSGKQKGLETTLIAYDALLVAGGDWKKLCYSAMFHWGESDVTGAIAGCLYGIQYGFDNVPSSLYLNLEFKDELEQLGRKLYYIANPER
uniref:ADP-ribosylhydrolase like 1 n=1 Tax=Callorhinchus milii TaxID=7868 RepID=A0A4W3IUE1_CALMI